MPGSNSTVCSNVADSRSRRRPLRRLHHLAALDADLAAEIDRRVEILEIDAEVQIGREGARQLEALQIRHELDGNACSAI